MAQVNDLPQTVNVKDAQGTYYVEVKASGTGCPPGTWATRTSDDGQVFTTTFSSYVTEVNPNFSINVRECQLTVKMHTPEGRSFSIQTFSYSGYALLQQGVVGEQTASYEFEGRPTPPQDSNRVILTGPYDDSYLFRDEIPIDDRVWSACGTERQLNIATRVRVTNAQKRAGYMNLTAVDGSGKLVFQMASKPCSQDAGVQPTAPAQATNVQVVPRTILPDQPFRVTWEPASGSFGATYKVQVREAESAGNALVWESTFGPETRRTYDGPALPHTGTFRISVITKVGDQQSVGATVDLIVSDGQTGPAPNLGAVPAWAAPLAGRYAARTYSFTSPVGSMLSGRQLSLAEFVKVGDALELRTRVCDQLSEAAGITVNLKTPEAFPELRRKVIFGSDQQWSTDAEPFATGYDRASLPACAGRAGQYVAKRPEQLWIRGASCRCAQPSEPLRADDCRVIDPDGDGQPGFAYQWRGPSSVNGNITHAATVNRSHHVRGTVDVNGSHFAAYENNEFTYQLQCEPNQCEVPPAARPCTSDFNGTQFVRLPAPPAGQQAWTCATLRAAENRLFTRPVPSAPTRCTRGGPLTDSP